MLVSWTLQLYGHQPTEKYLNFYLDQVPVKNRRLNGTMAINTRARRRHTAGREHTQRGHWTAPSTTSTPTTGRQPDEINILYQDMKASPTSLPTTSLSTSLPTFLPTSAPTSRPTSATPTTGQPTVSSAPTKPSLTLASALVLDGVSKSSWNAAYEETFKQSLVVVSDLIESTDDFVGNLTVSDGARRSRTRRRRSRARPSASRLWSG